ncbi:SRPBCC domain-containing protein [Tabrizicola sp. J26]|uniref:SRPBCC domain-containing protein n=1 Tax=Alitabrizicola rongguiensis TaxID=2909234 RepID=UPI001F488DF0|nr:SRPBCC domain-containing protein [Tabrizicola rongguiensis]MCF1709104.1 SRPBCC domain-containing protein [Tabrizicola rongguiensis]
MNRRTDQASRVIRASAERLWQAWFDPDQLVRWLPPGGMTGEVIALDPRPGGAFEMVLAYTDAGAGSGKSGAGQDRIGGRFVELDRPRFFSHEASFKSDDPAFLGVMRLEWRFDPARDGTKVTCTARNVPPGIRAEDHEAGLLASLAQLAAHVEGRQAGQNWERDER